MQLISKFKNRFRFLLCVIDIFSKYAWVVPLKDKKGVSIVNAFKDPNNRKPHKEGIDTNKTSKSKKCDICHYWYFLDKNFSYEPHLYNGCHDLMQKL